MSNSRKSLDYSFSDDESRRDEAALDWVIRRDAGFSAKEQDEFFTWLAKDARHGEWFKRHQKTFHQFDSLVQWCPEHSDEPNPDLLAAPWLKQSWFLKLGSLAAAAALLLGLFIWQPWAENSQSFDDLLPEAGAMALDYQIHRLPDGSIVELNKGTQIAIRYTGKQRRVDLLSGEAYFEVAKNPHRPFIVSARGIAVTAVGTAFNVKLADESLEVMVTHGRVLMDSSALVDMSELSEASEPLVFAPELTAGQRSHVSFVSRAILPEVAEITEEEVDEELAWKHQVLEFVDRPLGEIVQEFNHYNTRQITILDQELLDTAITASFRSYNLDGFVRLLELTCPVKASFESDDLISLTRVH